MVLEWKKTTSYSHREVAMETLLLGPEGYVISPLIQLGSISSLILYLHGP